METHASHSVLMKALATLGQRPPEELARLAGGPAVKDSLVLGGEHIEIEMLVAWDDAAHDAVRITGHARGAGVGPHGHLQESVLAPVRGIDRAH
jgi:hypothetical protein